MSGDTSAIKTDSPIKSEDGNTASEPIGKGKGKVVEDPNNMSMDDDESSEESALEDHAERKLPFISITVDPLEFDALAAEEEDEDNMEEIDPDNIITTGRRTRGKEIDFAKAAENDGAADDDEDDDEDFVGDDDAMEE